MESIPGKLSGAWVMKGTRMPVAAIFETSKPGQASMTSCNGTKDWTENMSKR